MEEAAAVLPVLPWLLAAVATVLVVALSVPPGGPRAATALSAPSLIASPWGAGIAVLAVVAALIVSRTGADTALDNPVPALVIGLGWPLLLTLPAAWGLLRRRPDAPGPAGAPDARPAVLAALAVVAYLTLPFAPTEPLAVGTAVTAYAVVVGAACVALGRRAAAERFEVLGLLAQWGAVGRALPRWAAPRGALAVLAVLLGGAWAERYERATSWVEGLPTRADTLLLFVAALMLAAAGAAALHLATRRGGSTGTAAAVLLPLALATAVAVVARRALISAQLLVAQATGPRPLDTDPLGIVGGQLLALGLVALGGALSSAVLARRMGVETARLPGVGVLLALTGISAWVVLQP